jgi:hypothetical protein
LRRVSCTVQWKIAVSRLFDLFKQRAKGSPIQFDPPAQSAQLGSQKYNIWTLTNVIVRGFDTNGGCRNA